MSKSDWKELPEWKNLEDYAFMEGEKPEAWAWEFLRRNPDYRTDWQQAKVSGEKHIYDPPKKAGELEDQWMWRIGVKENGNPQKILRKTFLARKWGLEQLYDPYASYTQGVSFKKLEYPHLIFFPEEFSDLIDDEDFVVDGTIRNGIQRVASNRAVVVFDLTPTIGAQIKIAAKKLHRWQTQMNNAKKIKIESLGVKPEKWLRHLRVLDALRAQPSATYQEIGRTLGGAQNKDAPPDKVRDDGDSFVESARRMVKSGYRKVLLSKSTPDTPPP